MGKAKQTFDDVPDVLEIKGKLVYLHAIQRQKRGGFSFVYGDLITDEGAGTPRWQFETFPDRPRKTVAQRRSIIAKALARAKAKKLTKVLERKQVDYDTFIEDMESWGNHD